jgi:hypothetical protein
MKKAYLLLLAIGLVLVAVAVAGVDFSGTWVFDASKSDQQMGGRGGTPSDMTITQTGNEITITTTRGGNPVETKYTMDGAEHTSSGPGGDVKYKAVLSGNDLTITGTRTTQRGEMPINTKYSLSADGKVLTVANTMNFQGQETVRKQVYNKK